MGFEALIHEAGQPPAIPGSNLCLLCPYLLTLSAWMVGQVPQTTNLGI